MRYPGEAAYFECSIECSIMSDKFESLDANEKASLEATLYRCRAIVGRIGEEPLRRSPTTSLTRGRLKTFTPSLSKSGDNTRPISPSRGATKKSNHRNATLLRARCERPSGSRTAEQRDELASS